MVHTQEEHWHTSINEWSNEDYFKNVINLLKQENIKNYIDLGANVGGVAEVLLNNISTLNKIYLFEPEKNNFSYLFNKLKNNNKIIFLNCGIYYGHHHLKVMNFVLHDHVGAYTVVNDEKTKESFLYKESENEFQLFELEFFNFGEIDFIKIDIEGSEYNIIENSSFLQTIKFLEIELHRGFDEEYFKKYFPNHQILWFGNYIDANGAAQINHVFLKKII